MENKQLTSRTEALSSVFLLLRLKILRYFDKNMQ